MSTNPSSSTEGMAYLAGAFNVRRSTLGTGHTVDSVRDRLRVLGIYLRETVAP